MHETLDSGHAERSPGRRLKKLLTSIREKIGVSRRAEAERNKRVFSTYVEVLQEALSLSDKNPHLLHESDRIALRAFLEIETTDFSDQFSGNALALLPATYSKTRFPLPNGVVRKRKPNDRATRNLLENRNENGARAANEYLQRLNFIRPISSRAYFVFDETETQLLIPSDWYFNTRTADSNVYINFLFVPSEEEECSIEQIQNFVDLRMLNIKNPEKKEGNNQWWGTVGEARYTYEWLLTLKDKAGKPLQVYYHSRETKDVRPIKRKKKAKRTNIVPFASRLRPALVP